MRSITTGVVPAEKVPAEKDKRGLLWIVGPVCVAVIVVLIIVLVIIFIRYRYAINWHDGFAIFYCLLHISCNVIIIIGSF